jgi:DNA-binding NarL/FixJ family response regulator
MGETVLTVVLQHHNRLFREMLAAHLTGEPDITLLGTVASGPELIKLCDLRRPAIALFEADTPRWSNDRLVPLLLPPGRLMRMIGLHQSLTTAHVIRAYEAGVSALVPYSGGLEPLLAAIRAPSSPIEAARAKCGGGDALTQRELEVLYLVCAGYPPRQIGLELGISPHTVENHKQRIFSKLGVHNQAHAAASAVRLGLLVQAPRRPDGGTPERRTGLRVVLAKSDGRLAARAARVLEKHQIIVLDRESVPQPRTDNDNHHAQDRGGESGIGAPIPVLIDPAPSEWRTQSGRGAVVLVSAEPKQHLMAQAVVSGVTILPASKVDDLLVSAVEAANAGYVLISSAYSRAVIGPPGGEWRRWQLALTPREQEILSAIAQGHTTKQTARLLGISVRTVENLQGNLFRKLRVHRKAAALVVAHELGLLEE